MTAVRLVLDKLWRGAALTGDDIVVIVLVLAMAASLTHLTTMLITRWGDRYIAMKSLTASLLVHGVCLLGLEVFDPLQFHSSPQPPEDITPVQSLTQILLESEDDVAIRETGNTPAPDAPSEPEITLDRTPPPARTLEEPDTPIRKPEELDALQTMLPDTTELIELPETQISAPVEHGEEGPVEVAAPDPSSELETRHDLNTADVHRADTERSVPTPGDARPQPSPVDRRATAAQADQMRPQPQIDEATLPIATTDRPSAILLKSLDPENLQDDVRSRSAPLPGEESVDTAGLETQMQPDRTLPARAFDRRVSRAERARPSDSQTERPTRIHSSSPRTPIPLSDSNDEVREGVFAPLTSDDLRSSASLVEVDTNRIQRQDNQPSAYRLRSREYRHDAVRKFGGTERSEATVELSLRWLASMQKPDGHWDAGESGAGQVEDDPLRKSEKFVGRDADSGITALVTLSFLGAGYTHENGRYAVHVDRALDWLISQQDEEGSLAGPAGKYARMYCHGMATYALAEALGMQQNMAMGPMFDPQLEAAGPAGAAAISSLTVAGAGIPPLITANIWSASSATLADVKAWNCRKVDDLRLRSALLDAIRFTIRCQHKEGSWRYVPRTPGDMSLFGWQLMSLKSAEIAGIRIHSRVRERMENFLDESRQGDAGGLFAYRNDEEPTPVMTAEALFCQQMLGQPRDTASNQESVNYLLDNLPRLSELNLYYWYYGTLAMYQHGGSAWQQWNDAVRDTLIGEQITDGPLAGSWNPNGAWGRYGGRLYATALSTLTLEVYYRLLPLYQMGDETRPVQDPAATGLRQNIFDR